MLLGQMGRGSLFGGRSPSWFWNWEAANSWRLWKTVPFHDPPSWHQQHRRGIHIRWTYN